MQSIKQMNYRPLVTLLSAVRATILVYWIYWIRTYLLPVIMIDEVGYFLLTVIPPLFIVFDLILSLGIYKSKDITSIFLVILNIGIILYFWAWFYDVFSTFGIVSISLIVISVLQIAVLFLSRTRSKQLV